MNRHAQPNLFSNQPEHTPQLSAPLAARMRPRSFEEFVGQEHLTGKDRVLRKSVESDRLSSMIFWGPPGTGKTTLAEIIASFTKSYFAPISAVAAGVADLRKVVDEAKKRQKTLGQRTVLFIDEIHRFNKAQQDVILPYVEGGVVTLIGATTENPSFEVNSALLSRSRVFTLRALAEDEVKTIVLRALADEERGLAREKVELERAALDHLASMANGDARVALNALELAAAAVTLDEKGARPIGLAAIEDALQRRSLLYDRAGEEHYNIISALHKTMRGSDPDGALYWLGRMLEAGEDPLYVARRLVRFASEDVGLADPQALVIALAAQQAVHFIGLPEGNLALAEAVVYLAVAPKSNSLYLAYGRVQEDVQKTRSDPVPLHLRNSVTGLMKDLGYGKGYKYAHDHEGHYVEQQGLPDALKGKRYYEPGELGQEKAVKERLEKLRGGG
ncbi:MAG: replication-associated recombination protein A [Chloroflexi bacterium]|nr:replication-associated recombination protein A [Chloroflexota bacterium]